MDGIGRGSSERRLVIGAVWIALYAIILGAWLAIKPGSAHFFVVGEDLLRILGPLLLLPICFAGVANLWTKGAAGRKNLEQWLPLLLGLSVLAFVIALGTRAYYVAVLNQPMPVPSVADIGFLIAYPCLFAAILILPGPAFSRASRTRIALDASLVVSGLAAFAWYFIVGPSILGEHGTVLSKLVNGAYPLFDIALAACLLLLATLSEELAFRRVATVLGAALAILIGVDCTREYQMLHGTYVSGTFLDLGRPVAFMLVCLAASATRLVQHSTPAAKSPEGPQREIRGLKRVPHAWRYMLPYCSVPAIVALMIYAARSPGNSRLALGVYIGGAILIELVLLHQFLDYRELIGFASRNARLESLAAADPVTGLPNHRTVVAALDREFVRSRRYQHPCAVLFMDLDHFKALNDSYGHPAGDAALREFGSVVRSALRGADLLGRWGGEEFVAVLPETDGESALAVAERVRVAVGAHTFWAAGGAHLTCSVGVAAYPNDAGSRDVLVERADQAMYVAKRLGRNQVCSATDPAVTALSGEVGPAGAREEATLAGMVEALVTALEAHHAGASQHLQEVAALCARLALELGLDTSEAHNAGLAGRLHDVGEVAVPSDLLDKPEPLSEEEWEIVRSHCSVGAAIVGRVPKLAGLASVIRAHHERWDGGGYPDGLAGESIPLNARILAVAEAYIAMISDRPYGAPRSAGEALATLQHAAGSQFDPEVVAAAQRVLAGAIIDVVA